MLYSLFSYLIQFIFLMKHLFTIKSCWKIQIKSIIHFNLTIKNKVNKLVFIYQLIDYFHLTTGNKLLDNWSGVLICFITLFTIWHKKCIFGHFLWAHYSRSSLLLQTIPVIRKTCFFIQTYYIQSPRYNRRRRLVFFFK